MNDARYVVLQNRKQIWIESTVTLINDDLFDNIVVGWFRYHSDAENRVYAEQYKNKKLKFVVKGGVCI